LEEWWYWDIVAIPGYDLGTRPVRGDASGPHVVYSVYSAPDELNPDPENPWKQTPGDPHNPWTEVLDRACVWAKGLPADPNAVPLEKEREIVKAIAEGAYSGLTRRYDAEAMLNYGGNLSDINLTALLAYSRIECLGFGAATQLFSEVLGVKADHVTRHRISPESGKIKTYPIKLIGRSAPRSESWEFHVFGFFGPYGALEDHDYDYGLWRVFDGLFTLDDTFLTDKNPPQYQGLLLDPSSPSVQWGNNADRVTTFH
jgi:hypothetical protein